MREHDREQVLTLFTLEPSETYAERGALAVARLAGGVGGVLRVRRAEHEVGRRAPHVLRVELQEGELLVHADEPLEGEGERAARFGVELLERGLTLIEQLAQGSARLEARLAAAPLGPRERELARLIALGTSTDGIASRMKLTDASVRTYVKRVLAKMNVGSRLELAALLTRESDANG